MTTSRDRPLADWTDAELRESQRHMAPLLVYSYADLAGELERRRDRRLRRLATIAAVASAVAAILSAVVAVVALSRLPA